MIYFAVASVLVGLYILARILGEIKRMARDMRGVAGNVRGLDDELSKLRSKIAPTFDEIMRD
jgi:hypothetical protein